MMQSVLSGNGSVGLQARPTPAPHSPCMHVARPARVVAAAASKGSGRPEDKVLLLGVTGITGRCVFQCDGAGVGWIQLGCRALSLRTEGSSAVLSVAVCTLVLADRALSPWVRSVRQLLWASQRHPRPFVGVVGCMFCSATIPRERSCIKHVQCTSSTTVTQHIALVAPVLTLCLQVCSRWTAAWWPVTLSADCCQP
jgi:hypothetical protein